MLYLVMLFMVLFRALLKVRQDGVGRSAAAAFGAGSS